MIIGIAKKVLVLAAAMLLSGKACAEAQQWWGYYNGGPRAAMGLLGIAETIDLSIYIPGDKAELVGKRIKSVRFFLRDTDSFSDVSVWLSSAKPAGASAADIARVSLDASQLQGGDGSAGAIGAANEVSLPSPYTLTASGVYVGFSFTIANTSTVAGRAPIVVSAGTSDEEYDNAYYIRATSTGGVWANFSKGGSGNLALQVLFEGDFPEDAVTPVDFDELVGVLGQTGSYPVSLQNTGLQPVNSIDYQMTIGGQVAAELHFDLSTPLTRFGDVALVSLPIVSAVVSSTGKAVLTVTKVNGLPNAAADVQAEGVFVTVPRLVPHGVVIEEHTGTLCGWCPRGLAGMERLRHAYGTRFVGIGIHGYNKDDPMYPDYTDFFGTSAPKCMIDRGPIIDPYFGITGDIVEDFGRALAVVPKVAVDVTGEWNADQSAVTATATVEALTEGDSYTIEFVLIADSLTGTTNDWRQENFYSDYTYEDLKERYPGLEVFGKGGEHGEYFTFWKFNDVAICHSKTRATLPATPFGQPVTSTFTLSLPTKAALRSAIKPDNVAVIAFVVDKKTKRIVNGAKYYLSGTDPTATAIREARPTAEAAQEVARYTVDGRLISTPQKGINIVRLSNGKTVKVVVK